MTQSQLALTSAFSISALTPGQNLPAVLQPVSPDADLLELLAEPGIATQIEQLTLQHGGLLFRGFAGMASADAFGRFTRSFSHPMLDYTEQSSPRDKLGDKVYSSTTYPQEEYIPFHNANSFGHEFPMNIWFACIRNGTSGGRTPIADTRAVLANLSDATRRRFADLGILYVRNYYRGMGVPWQETFATDSVDVANQFMEEGKIAHRWHDSGNLVLETRQLRHAILRHPKTGEDVWFNQAHLFHKRSLAPRLQPLLKQFNDWQLPRNAFFGDGTPIPDAVIDEVMDAYDRAEVSFDWDEGDVMMLDNLLTAHARTPFTGDQRLISVAFSEMHQDYAAEFSRYGVATL